MKKVIYVLFVFLFAQCAGTQKVSYHFPAAMKPEVQQQYYELCEKGRIIYSINCAKCHNKGKKKDIVPTFREEQLLGYTLRISNASHESALPDTLVTEEELGLIMNYLRYK